jgi:hypothetical protein
VFTPIGGSEIYFDNVGGGMSQEQTVTMGIDSSTLAGYYELPVTVTSNGQTYNQTFGITVNATPSLDVSASTQPSFVSSGTSNVVVLAEIANTGNGPIRSVYITTGPSSQIQVIGATNKFIGTLNIDDFAAFQVTVNVPPNLAPGNYSIPIIVSFKDSTNTPYSITEAIPLTVYSAGQAAAYNGGTSTPGGSGTYAGRRSSGGLFGLGLIPTVVIGIVILVLAFFGYKKYIAKKKPAAQGTKQ